MLHLIPASLHRQLYRLAHWARRRWWRVRKSRGMSVNVLAIDDAGRVLLVRHSYGRQVWMLPGGGVGRNEAPMAAAVREFREELGCGLDGLVPLSANNELVSGSIAMQHVFVARISGTPRPDGRELVAAQWFAPGALPVDIGRITARRIAEWSGSRSKQG